MIRKILVGVLVSLSIAGSAQLVCAQAPPFDSPANAAGNPNQDGHIGRWFYQYDGIRRAAQMNPEEKARADAAMAGGMKSMLTGGPEKAAAAEILTKLARSNQQAADAMKGLKLYPETAQLHRGYFKYFNDAQALFTDYLAVQNNLFATDASGKSIASNLLLRKQALADLDASNKILDGQLRQRFNIPPYKY